jgi:transcriptional regulator with XRE-family HTH domain
VNNRWPDISAAGLPVSRYAPTDMKPSWLTSNASSRKPASLNQDRIAGSGQGGRPSTAVKPQAPVHDPSFAGIQITHNGIQISIAGKPSSALLWAIRTQANGIPVTTRIVAHSELQLEALHRFAEKTMPDAESSALASFAAELRAHRKRLDWTQVVLGDKIGYSGSFVSDVERGARPPALDFAQACDREFDLPGTFERWHDLIRREAYPTWFAPYAEFEATCTRLHNRDTRCFTGLLQTERYARAIISAAHPHWDDARIERDVAMRMDRQAILTSESPVSAWFVIGEAVFHTVFGDREVMRAQIDHVAKLAALPAVTIQVYPFSVPDCPGSDGPVTRFDFEGRPSAGYAEAYEAGRVIESPADLASLEELFDHLRASALRPPGYARLAHSTQERTLWRGLTPHGASRPTAAAATA